MTNCVCFNCLDSHADYISKTTHMHHFFIQCDFWTLWQFSWCLVSSNLFNSSEYTEIILIKSQFKTKTNWYTTFCRNKTNSATRSGVVKCVVCCYWFREKLKVIVCCYCNWRDMCWDMLHSKVAKTSYDRRYP